MIRKKNFRLLSIYFGFLVQNNYGMQEKKPDITAIAGILAITLSINKREKAELIKKQEEEKAELIKKEESFIEQRRHIPLPPEEEYLERPLTEDPSIFIKEQIEKQPPLINKDIMETIKREEREEKAELIKKQEEEKAELIKKEESFIEQRRHIPLPPEEEYLERPLTEDPSIFIKESTEEQRQLVCQDTTTITVYQDTTTITYYYYLDYYIN